MRTNAAVRFGLILGCLTINMQLFVNSSYGDEPSAHAAKCVASAKDAIGDRQRYVTLMQGLGKCSEDELRQLIVQNNDTLSIASAFELFVVRPALKRSANRAEDNVANNDAVAVTKTNAVEKADAAKFVGFCEGRLQIILPDWYLTVLQTGFVRGNGGCVMFLFEDRIHGPAVEKHTTSYIGPNNQKEKWVVLSNPPNDLTVSGEDVVLHGESTKLTIPLSSMEKSHNREKGFAFTNDDRRYWVSIYDRDMVSDDQCLKCFDVDEVLWESEVWGTVSESRGGSVPRRYQLVSVIREENTIYVVGAGMHGVYIEAFDAGNGHAVMRFMTPLGCFDGKAGAK